MSESLDVALRISAVGAFDGVLNRLHNRIRGLGSEAGRVQGEYDKMFRHIFKGIAGIAAAKYGLDKLGVGVKAAADLQESLLGVKSILQGAHPQAAKLADQMERIRANSIEAASGLKFSATELTEVTHQLIKSGVPLAGILDKIGKGGKVQRRGAAFLVESLAETQGTTPSETAAQVGNIAHAFRLNPSQIPNAINLIAKAGPTASGSLTQLFHNLEQSGAIAKFAGNTDLLTTLAALKTVAPLGEQGGSDLAAFLQRVAGMSVRGQARQRKAGITFFDHGQFIGLTKTIEKIKKITAGKTQEQISHVLGPILGSQGLKALALLNAPSAPGAKSFQEIKKSISEQASLEQQVAVQNEGLTRNLQELSTTNKTTLATLFTPALDPITSIVRKTAKMSGQLGVAATKNKDIARAVTFGSAGLVGGAGLFGIGHLLAAIKPGTRVLRGLFGKMGRTAGGIAEGKAIQAAAGVQPVFVVNMPAGGVLGNGRGSALDALIASRGRGVASSLREVNAASFAAKNGIRGIASASVKTIGALSFAATAGYAIGTAIYQKGIKGSKTEKGIYAFWDWESSKLGIGRGATLAAAHKRADQIAKQALRRQAENRAKVDLHLHIDHDGKLRLRRLHSDNSDVEASVGTAMATP